MLVAAGLVCLVVAASAGAAQGGHAAIFKPSQARDVRAVDCPAQATADGFLCYRVRVPKDYGNPRGGHLQLAVTVLPASDQAHKIGPLFVNYGGPGGDAVSTTQDVGKTLFGAFTQKFDLVAIDPRGVGRSEPSIDCKADQRTQGIYSIPFTTPENLVPGDFLAKVRGYVRQCVRLNRGVLPYVSTANVARDMELVRKQLLHAPKLNYFGFSYGTFLGATYVSMFPHSYRTAVLDGALDASGYINRPMPDLREQTAGFERELGRYFQACAAHADFCTWANGDPEGTFDDLIAAADENPLPVKDPDVTGGDTTPVLGDDILNGTIGELYAKQLWPELTAALNQAASGDGTFFRVLSNGSLGRNPDGSYDPGLDRYFTIGAIEQDYRPGIQRYLDAGEESWMTWDHFWFNSGYPEANYGLFPIDGRDVYNGPFDVPAGAGTPLVVGTTYDPATVYRQARRLVDDLGNARLLTMKGDGHTAYFGNSQCIDDAVNAYVIDDVLPPTGTRCDQQVPFPPAPSLLSEHGQHAKLRALEEMRPSGR